MIKILLKEPVGGGLFGANQQPARSSEYMEAKGVVGKNLFDVFDSAVKENGIVSFIDPSDKPFLVPARNIAYILEIPPRG